jgi:hypothetical protein
MHGGPYVSFEFTRLEMDGYVFGDDGRCAAVTRRKKSSVCSYVCEKSKDDAQRCPYSPVIKEVVPAGGKEGLPDMAWHGCMACSC